MGFGGSVITKSVKKLIGEVCHIGIAIRGSDFPVDHEFYNPNELYIWESTISGPYGDGNLNLDGNVCEPRCCHICCGCPWIGPTCCCTPCSHEKGFMGVQLRRLEDTVK